MTYWIAYGVDTESIEDPDQVALLALPDVCAQMESEELRSFINDNFEAISKYPIGVVIDNATFDEAAPE